MKKTLLFPILVLLAVCAGSLIAYAITPITYQIPITGTVPAAKTPAATMTVNGIPYTSGTQVILNPPTTFDTSTGGTISIPVVITNTGNVNLQALVTYSLQTVGLTFDTSAIHTKVINAGAALAGNIILNIPAAMATYSATITITLNQAT
jgi:hypothetical protein